MNKLAEKYGIGKREIEFRAWDKNNYPKMIYFCPYEKAFPVNGNKIACNKLPIMQYIGLKDKNGKKIFEGDIVRVHFNAGELTSGAYLSMSKEQINNGYFSLAIDSLFILHEMQIPEDFRLEVLGNIFENPELLDV